MRPSTFFLFGVLFALWSAALLAQVPAVQDSSPAPNASQPQRLPAERPTSSSSAESPAPSEGARLALLERVIANQKKDDLEQYTYERLERLEVQKGSSAPQSPEVRAARGVPRGKGLDRVSVGAA